MVARILGMAFLAGCLGLLWASIYPGLLSMLFGLAMLLALASSPFLFAVLYLLAWSSDRSKESESSLRRQGIHLVLLVLGAGIVTLALLVKAIPLRIAFRLSQLAFEAAVAEAPLSEYGGESPGRRFGIYSIDRYAEDPRGGVYFRVGTGPAGIGPNLMSYGFVRHPNPIGSPFGRSGYRTSHLRGDWHIFEASDDSY
jgi:hypothetical protein